MDEFIENLREEYKQKSHAIKHFHTNPKHVALSGKIQNMKLKINR